jgi:hypothetical protein
VVRHHPVKVQLRDRIGVLAALLPWCALSLPFLYIALIGMPLGHDWPLELVRVAAYRHALEDGQLPPYWAGDLYQGFGSPIFLFYGQICLAIASVTSWLTGSFSSGLILALLMASIVGLIGVQRLAAGLSEPASSTAAASGRIAAYLFLLDPYLLGDAFRRNASAEYVALCGVPLALSAVARLERDKSSGLLVLALATAWVVAAHNVTAVSYVALLGLLVLATGRRTLVHWRTLALGVGLGLALSAFVWLPALVLKPAIRSHELLSGKLDYHNQFQPPLSMFDASSFHSSSPLPLVAAGLAGYVWLSRKRDMPGWIPAWLLALGVLVSMQTTLALPVWEHAPVLAYFQFPWRLMGPLAVVSSQLGGLAFGELSARLRPSLRACAEGGVLCLCLLFAALQLSRVQPMAASQTAQLEAMLAPQALSARLHTSTVGDEYLPLRSDKRAIRDAVGTAPIVSADAGVRIALRKNQPRTIALVIDAPQPGPLCLGRWSLGLWHVDVDGAPQASTACADGSVQVQLPAGRHEVHVQLGPPPVRQLALAFGVVALLALPFFMRRVR